MRYTTDEVKYIEEEVEKANLEGKTNKVWKKIGEDLNRSPDAIRKYARNVLNTPNVRNNLQSDARLIETKKDFLEIDNSLKAIKELKLINFHEIYENYSINSNNLTVCGDFHFPYFNRKTLRFLIQTCKGTDLLIAGDLFDWSCLASQKKRNDANEGNMEILVNLRRFIKILLRYFKRIWIMPGNHDFRLEVLSEGKLSWAMLLTEFIDEYPDRFKILDFPRVQVNEDWVVIHPDTYRVVPGSVSRSFSTIEMKNIICGHSHTTCQSDALNGKYSFDIGGCVDEALIAYRYYTAKPYGLWKNGFITIINNKFKLYTEGNEF
jgi:UDP-2,3-diacylglucosamine pyrophosphatase LpxH